MGSSTARRVLHVGVITCSEAGPRHREAWPNSAATFRRKRNKNAPLGASTMSRKLCFRLIRAAPPEPNEWSPEGPERSGGAEGLTTRSVEANSRAIVQRGSRTFGDWQRYRSTFNEAIGLPAMSEHLPGVTKTVQPAVSFDGAATAERSSPGRISSSILVLRIANHAPTRLECYAARRCSP